MTISYVPTPFPCVLPGQWSACVFLEGSIS
jgi:hypothetical protein